MRRPHRHVIALVSAGVAASATVVGGWSSAALGAGHVHRPAHLRLVVVPAHPAVGQRVRLYVTGSAHGGRYYTIVAGELGNFGFRGGPSCASSAPTRHVYREPLTLHMGNTWKKAGSYRVSLTIGAPCVHPALAEHTVNGVVTVSGQQ